MLNRVWNRSSCSMLGRLAGSSLGVGLATGLSVGVMLGGCASSSPRPLAQTSPEERLAKTDIDDAAYAKLGYRRDWSGFPVVMPGGSIRQVTVADDLVLVQDTGTTVTALSASNGSPVWAQQLGSPLTRFYGLDRVDAGVLVSSDAEAFVIDVKSGTYRSRHAFDKVINTPPVVVGDLAFYGTSVGELLSHRISNGLKYRGVALSGAITQPPVRVGGLIGAVNQSGEVMFVDASTATLQSRAKVFGGLATRPISDGNAMYFACLDQSVYAYSPAGTQIWRFKTAASLRSQPAIFAGTIFVTVPGEGMVALDAGMGTVKWRNSALAGEVIAVRKNDLIVWDGSFLNRVDAVHGEIVAKFKMNGVAQYVVDKFEDGALFAVSTSGVVTRFVTR
ncbi:MAG: PQQ-binding-like beta-propeller repeat protein [Planctomycetota bacterium]|nr:PQQ-binding-like beta-propeller repeat protein [Planctomycetota bacterium]